MTNTEDTPNPVGHLTAGGRAIGDPETQIRRYCGLEWDGHPPETWAFQFFDRLQPSGRPDEVDHQDVLAAGVLHHGLSRDELAFFVERATELDGWVRSLPDDVSLDEADDTLIAHLAAISRIEHAPLSLLTKVLHRKRPALVPLLDRPLIDRYRMVTGERAATKAWGPLLVAMRDDLRNVANARTLSSCARLVEVEVGVRLSRLRLMDIAIWMAGRS